MKPITPEDISLTPDQLDVLDTRAGKACKPRCTCENGGRACEDRIDRFRLLVAIEREGEARALGYKPDWSDWTPPELSLLVTTTAKMRRLEGPNVRRMDILLKGGNARAVRLVRLYLDDKLSFEYLLDTVSPRRFHGA